MGSAPLGNKWQHHPVAAHVCPAEVVAVIVYIMPTATGGPGERWRVRLGPIANALHSAARMVQAPMVPHSCWREVQYV